MELLGHKEKVATLLREIKSGTSVQSYIFSGPQSIGKFQAALFLAKELVDEPSFESTSDMRYPADVLVLEPATITKGEKTKSKGISVEDIREAIQFLTRYPSKGQYRVLIIRDAHTLAPAGQNMILKTLEEPPTSALLILVTHEPGTLLETVRSRVSEQTFVPITREAVAEFYSDSWLADHNIPPFFRDFGRPGVLEKAAEHPEEFQKKKEQVGKLYKITQLSVQERLTLAEEMSKDVPVAIELLEWWVTGLRGQGVRQPKKEQKVQFYGFLKNILEVIETLKTTQGNARLLLEQLFFQIH